MQKAAVEVRAGLLPIGEHHHRKRSIFRSRRREPHGLIESVHVIVLKEPITCLAQLGFTPQIVNLELELPLFVCRL